MPTQLYGLPFVLVRNPDGTTEYYRINSTAAGYGDRRAWHLTKRDSTAYRVWERADGSWSCSCKAFIFGHGKACKHATAVRDSEYGSAARPEVAVQQDARSPEAANGGADDRRPGPELPDDRRAGDRGRAVPADAPPAPGEGHLPPPGEAGEGGEGPVDVAAGGVLAPVRRNAAVPAAEKTGKIAV